MLVEGPPDADPLLPLADREGMEPPVALLVHDEDDPTRSSFWPFARFSPEWQAILWALRQAVPVRFCDLPFSHRPLPAPPAPTEASADADPSPDEPRNAIARDPLGILARMAGEEDGEAWWNRVVEERGGPEVFDAVLEAMRELRRDPSEPDDPEEVLREAWMRQTLREAVKSGHERIAVVCGAWHGPALEDLPPAKADQSLLKGLPRRKTRASWVPWTHARLARASGYGAGVSSPGWYDHLWRGDVDADSRWVIGAATALRSRGIDASSASVIEAVRLAHTLSSLRGRVRPDREDFDEAILAILCGGDTVLHGLVRTGIEVGEHQGRLCPEAPRTPLQANLEALQKRLRLAPEAVERALDLDLRKDTDRERSVLLRRLRILDVPWGVADSRRDRTSTFHERWTLQWKPEFAVALVDASRLGSTVRDAACAALASIDASADLPTRVRRLEEGILADLPEAVEAACRAVREAAAVTDDTALLLESSAPLARMARYGDVRTTDRDLVLPAARELLARSCLSLGGACRGADDEAATRLVAAIEAVHAVSETFESPEHPSPWVDALRDLARDGSAHGLAAGRAARLLLDAGAFDADETRRLLGLSTSPGTEPAAGARWIEGFLRDGLRLLLHDDRLRELVGAWFSNLPEDRFQESLPLLRRAFSGSSPGDRARLLGRLAPGSSPTDSVSISADAARAEAVLPAILELLGRVP